MPLDNSTKNSSSELKYQLNAQKHNIAGLSQSLTHIFAQINDLHQVNHDLLQLMDTSLSTQQVDATDPMQQPLVLSNKDAHHLIKDLSRALAHEINQPLTILSLYSSTCILLLKGTPNCEALSDKLMPMLECMVSQATLAGNIAHNMQNLIQIDELSIEETDINILIKEILVLLNFELMNINPKIVLNLADNLPLLMTNRVHIIQVIMNLIRNSMQALHSIAETNPELEVTTYQKDGHIIVHITDNGPGIPLALQNKVFNLQFTTKTQGMGIGLDICRDLIEMLDGEIHICNHKDTGACFMFKLPFSIPEL